MAMAMEFQQSDCLKHHLSEYDYLDSHLISDTGMATMLPEHNITCMYHVHDNLYPSNGFPCMENTGQ